MPHIISVSRRTDIPAFYGRWFMNRLEAGWAEYRNPFSGKACRVSLAPEDVACFVFWSKNFSPFLHHLQELKNRGFGCCFNYTITGLPDVFEFHVPPAWESIKTLKQLSSMFSPEHINWRYDPIIISDLTPADYHLRMFRQLAAELQGSVTRCYFSFVQWYAKVRKNIDVLTRKTGLSVSEPGLSEKLKLAGELKEIGAKYGITLFSCSGDDMLSAGVHKGHCVDGDLINRFYYSGRPLRFSPKPTREECGCTGSFDVGAYDTCPHGCVYCYANVNKDKAAQAVKRHDESAGLL